MSILPALIEAREKKQPQYATSTHDIMRKYIATDNVVTKWSYKSILESRAKRGDSHARWYLMRLKIGLSCVLREA